MNRRISVLVAIIAIIALLIPGAALANIPGSTFEGGDGNLVVNTAGNTDWTNVTNKTSAADLLVGYDFLGGAQKPTITIRVWTGSVWGPAQTLTAAQAEAEVNRGGTVSDVPIGGTNATLPAFQFGEANINLTAAGVIPPNACEGFSSIYVKSRSSDSFSAALKDFIAPTPVNISNCGTVTIIKHTNPAGLDQAFGFTSTVTGTGGASSYNLNDAATDTKTVTNVPIGSYTVTEGADPAGFQFASVSCVNTGSATGVQHAAGSKQVDIGIVAGGDTVTCTYVNDQQLGSIKITKTSSKGTHPGLAGAVFTITPPTGPAFDVTTAGASGTICTDGLPFGTYAVVEKTPPTGYAIDDTTSHNVAVDTNTSCAANPYVGETFSATDTPTARIHVSFDDEGSGATSATISCDNTTGTTTTPSETGWDLTKQVTGIHAPTTIVCTIVVDP